MYYETYLKTEKNMEKDTVETLNWETRGTNVIPRNKRIRTGTWVVSAITYF